MYVVYNSRVCVENRCVSTLARKGHVEPRALDGARFFCFFFAVGLTQNQSPTINSRRVSTGCCFSLSDLFHTTVQLVSYDSATKRFILAQHQLILIVIVLK